MPEDDKWDRGLTHARDAGFAGMWNPGLSGAFRAGSAARFGSINSDRGFEGGAAVLFVGSTGSLRGSFMLAGTRGMFMFTSDAGKVIGT